MPSRFSCVPLCVTPLTAACQAPLSMGFPPEEYWRGLQRPPPGDRPSLGIEPESLVSPALAGGFSTTSVTGKPFKLFTRVLLSLSLYCLPHNRPKTDR